MREILILKWISLFPKDGKQHLNPSRRPGPWPLLDEQENVIYIKGAMNMKSEIEEQMELNEAARFFMCDQEPMYTKRESDLLQRYIAEHGEMPEGNREVDDRSISLNEALP